jgi:hypothetical protein
MFFMGCLESDFWNTSRNSPLPSVGQCGFRELDRDVLRPAKTGIGGVKGHNMNKTSFAHIVFATGVLGKPRAVGGELQIYLEQIISL